VSAGEQGRAADRRQLERHGARAPSPLHWSTPAEPAGQVQRRVAGSR